MLSWLNSRLALPLGILVLLAPIAQARGSEPFDGHWIGSAQSEMCAKSNAGASAGWDFDGPVETVVSSSRFKSQLGDLRLSGTIDTAGIAHGSGYASDAVFKVNGHFEQRQARLAAEYWRDNGTCSVTLTLTRDQTSSETRSSAHKTELARSANNLPAEGSDLQALGALLQIDTGNGWVVVVQRSAADITSLRLFIYENYQPKVLEFRCKNIHESFEEWATECKHPWGQAALDWVYRFSKTNSADIKMTHVGAVVSGATWTKDGDIALKDFPIFIKELTSVFKENNMELALADMKNRISIESNIGSVHNENQTPHVGEDGTTARKGNGSDRLPAALDRTPVECASDQIERRLRTVNDLLARGLLATDEADKKKQEILACL